MLCPAETTTLNVGAVPAMDSAGFFVALNEGLFGKEGLTINYTPSVSSTVSIDFGSIPAEARLR